MSEFDDYDDENDEVKKEKLPSKTIALIVVIIASIIIGIIVYVVVNSVMDKKDPVPDNNLGEQLRLDDKNVQLLYQYVTSGIDGSRNMKFITTSTVDINSFSNKEKIEYALQFAQPEDFSFTGDLNEKKQKIYFFSNRTLKKYMSLYFGPSVTFEPEQKFSYPFLFYINKMNVGELTFKDEDDGYDVIFTGQYNFDKQKDLIDHAYGQLISALKKYDGTVILQERVVYTELRTDNGGYAVDIYQDPAKTKKLDTKTGLTEDSLEQFQVDISGYSSTVIVEYFFGLNGQSLYFKNSRMILGE